MGDGAFVWAFGFGFFYVGVNPLMVGRCVGKLADSLLVNGSPIAFAELFSEMSCEFIVAVYDTFLHYFSV